MKIKVLTKKETIIVKGKEKTIYRYFTPCNINVIDKDGNDLGVQQKNLSVHFTMECEKKLPDQMIFGIFTFENPEDYSLPYQLDMRKFEDEDHKSENYVWIRDYKSIDKIPYKGRKSTCEPLIDEEDTEPVELTEETIIEE